MDLFLTRCWNFFITIFYPNFCNFDLRDPIYQFSSLGQPENARKLQPPPLSAVFKRIPVLKEKCNIVNCETNGGDNRIL